MAELKPSPFDRSKWGCPRCGWPLDPADDIHETGNVLCACGAYVSLPDKLYPRLEEKLNNDHPLRTPKEDN